MYLLLSSEYVSGMDVDKIKYVYLDTETGKRFVSLDMCAKEPYYILCDIPEDVLLNDPTLISARYVQGGKWNRSLVTGTELVTMHDKMRGVDKEITKIFLSPDYNRLVWKKTYEPIDSVVPKEHLFGMSEKKIDQFTRLRGHVMGMLYTEVDGELVPAIDEDDMPMHSSFEQYPRSVVDWMRPRLFAPIPSISDHVLSIDIEVDIPQRRMPDITQVEFMVSSIALVSSTEKIGFYMVDEVRGTVPESFQKYDFTGVDLRGYTSEKEMLDEAIRYIIESRYPIVVGFYSDNFDIPYLMTRAELFGLVYDGMYGRVEKYGDKTRVIKGLKNKWLLDLHTFMSNPSIKNYAFGGKYEFNTLEDISQGILGYGKYVHEKWYSDMSSYELMYYNIKDTELLIDLLKYENEIILKLMVMLMRIGGLTFESVCRRMISATVKGLIDQLMAVENIIPPNRTQLMSVGLVESESSTGKSFKGAYVIDPRPVSEGGRGTRGVHFDVWAVDYQSLYPSEIKDRNICWSTVNCGHEECRENVVPELSHHVCTKDRGFYPLIVGFIRDARVYYFKKESRVRPEFKVIEQTLKVLINAAYGVMSSKMFEYYSPPLGEIVTAYGRSDIHSVFSKVEEDGRRVLYADSVTGDTPILIRQDGDVKIVRIDRLSDKFYGYEKQYSLIDDIDVWSDEGWTPIKSVMRHKTRKRIYRIITHTGAVDVTEDHSLLNLDGEKVKPSELSIGDELLHDFPIEFNCDKYDISIEEAEIMGMFFADGRNNSDYELLEYYGVYELVPSNGKMIKWVEMYRGQLYGEDNEKIVPTSVLNGTYEVREAFLKGYYSGDGNHRYDYKESGRFTVKNKTSAMSLFYLIKSLGYNISINWYRKDYYDIFFTRNKMRKNIKKIKKIIEIGYIDDYVYDLTTDNHHFHAGVGQLIVHNTDSAFIGKTDGEYIDYLIRWVGENVGLELGVDYVAKFMALYRSKNYFMNVGGKFIVKGMLGKKKNTPPIIREAFTNLLEVTKDMTEDNYDEVRHRILTLVRRYREFIMNGKIDDVSVFKITVTMNFDINIYNREIHSVRVARMMAHEINRGLERKVDMAKLIPIGSVVEYVYVLPEFSMDGNETSFIRPLEYTEPHMVNRDKYLDRLMSSVLQITECFGISVDEIEGQMKLDNWF